MDNTVAAGVRKREQIKRANRMMFLWVAGVSVVIGVSAVLSIFLFQQIMFNEKVLTEKNKTVDTLKKNLQAVNGLKDSINVLNTNEALIATKLNDSDSAVQSVLDAVPATANPTALASSLQTKLLAGIPGITLDKLSVGGNDGEADEADSGEISYSFTVSASQNNYDALRKVLERLEKSIRPFKNRVVTVDVQSNSVAMTVDGTGYYEPAKTIQTVDKVVKQ